MNVRLATRYVYNLDTGTPAQSFADIQDKLRDLVSNNWANNAPAPYDATPIVFEDDPFTPKPKQDYIECYIREVSKKQVSMGHPGHNRWRIIGNVACIINARQDQGAQLTRIYADIIVSILQGVRVDNIHLQATRAVPAGKVGNYNKLNAITDFMCDYIG